MPTYLVNFDAIEKYRYSVDTYEPHAGVYWVTGDRIILEVPSVSGHGAYMGVTWRCELSKLELVEFMRQRSGGDVEAKVLIGAFEEAYLSKYTRVEARFD